MPDIRDRPRLHRAGCVYAIIVLNLVAYLAVLLLSNPQSVAVCFGYIPAAGDPVTWFTHMFLHASHWHLLGNMLYLWMFGRYVEDVVGGVAFGLAYLLCGLYALAVHTLLTPASGAPLVGASGAISGALGMYVALFPRERMDLRIYISSWRVKTLELSAAWAIASWLAYQVVLGILTTVFTLPLGEAFWAHAGGLLAGVAIGGLLSRLGLLESYEELRRSRAPGAAAKRRRSLAEPWKETPIAVGILALAAVAGLLVLRSGAVDGRRWLPAPRILVGRPSPAAPASAVHPGESYVGAVAFDARGYLWAVGSDGAIRWDPGDLTYARYAAADGPASRAVLSVAAGPEGSIWLGTREGVTCYDGERRRSYGADDGLAVGPVRALTAAGDGVVWAAGEQGLARLDGHWTTFAGPDGFPAMPEELSVAADKRGGAWVSDLTALWHHDGTRWMKYNINSDWSPSAGGAWCLAVDPDGALWVDSVMGGIKRYDGEYWTTLSAEDGAPGWGCASLVPLGSGEVWLVGWTGIAVCDGERCLTTDKALIAAPDALGTRAVAGPDGAVWFACGDGGLLRFDARYGPQRLYDWRLWTRYLTAEQASADPDRAAAAPG